MEHGVFDQARLEKFMQSLVDGGPTNSGHRTPAVIVEMSMDGSSADVIRANKWHFRQILTRGVHGILRCHAENPEAVKDFVEVCRTLFRRKVLIPTSKLGDMVLPGNRRQRRFGFFGTGISGQSRSVAFGRTSAGPEYREPKSFAKCRNDGPGARYRLRGVESWRHEHVVRYRSLLNPQPAEMVEARNRVFSPVNPLASLF